jgi:hypothetical protein
LSEPAVAEVAAVVEGPLGIANDDVALSSTGGALGTGERT